MKENIMVQMGRKLYNLDQNIKVFKEAVKIVKWANEGFKKERG